VVLHCLDLARILRVVLAKIYTGLANQDLNYVVLTATGENRHFNYCHWYVSLIHRLTKVAGFELGCGMFINPTIPEANARFLREVEVSML